MLLKLNLTLEYQTLRLSQTVTRIRLKILFYNIRQNHTKQTNLRGHNIQLPVDKVMTLEN
jgi:hypothetical protein